MAVLTTVDWTKFTMPLILKRQNPMMLRVIKLSLITKGISLFHEKPNVFTKPFRLSNVLNPMGVTWDMVVKK